MTQDITSSVIRQRRCVAAPFHPSLRTPPRYPAYRRRKKRLAAKAALPVRQTCLVASRSARRNNAAAKLRLERIQVLLAGRPEWRGTLEDASVVLLALKAGAPVWTLNYRDLGVFQELSFWAG